MNSISSGRRFLGALMSLGILAACGAQQTAQSSSPLPRGAGANIIASPAQHATSEALIYATGGCGGTCVLSYPDGQIVGSISQYGSGPCSDAAGNIFIPDGNQIFEFSHGGTTPIATLTIPGSSITSFNCSVDPTTNNLAVLYQNKSGGIAVFANESGTPTIYVSGIDSFFCGYDNAGNLFVDGIGTDQNPGIELSELAVGQSEFTPLKIDGKLGGQLGQLQWDGSYLTYEGAGAHATISRLAVSGSVATVVKTISLKGTIKASTLSWIYDGSVIMPYSIQSQRVNKIGLWAYPKGGKRKTEYKFANSKYWIFSGVTVSAAPTR